MWNESFLRYFETFSVSGTDRPSSSKPPPNEKKDSTVSLQANMLNVFRLCLVLCFSYIVLSVSQSMHPPSRFSSRLRCFRQQLSIMRQPIRYASLRRRWANLSQSGLRQMPRRQTRMRSKMSLSICVWIYHQQNLRR